MIRGYPVDQLVDSYAIRQVRCSGMCFQVPWAWDLGNCGITGQLKEKQSLSKLNSQLHVFMTIVTNDATMTNKRL